MVPRADPQTGAPTLAPVVDRLERLTNLVLVLLDQRPKSLREIATEVPGYPKEGEARRQAFERDKRTLRDGGVTITTVDIGGKDQTGYTIRGEDYYLPDLHLEADEQAALNLAVTGVHLGEPSGRDALWRLGLPATASARPLADLPSLPALPHLYDAVRRRATVAFSYRGETRHVAPAALRFRGGWWYLVGFDSDKGAPRTFRVDRMEGDVSVGADDSAHVPEGYDPDNALPDEPWRMGEGDPVAVDVLVDAVVAPLVVAEVGEHAVLERRDDGATVIRLQVTNVDALRGWVLELSDHAEVLGPAAVRAEMVSWLESLVSAGSLGPTAGPS